MIGNFRSPPRLVLGALMALGMAKSALAEVFCVDTVLGLENALATAATNTQDDEVRIVQGTYVGNFAYDSTQAHKLSVLGGYTAGCAGRVLDPANTILDGDQTNTVLVLSAPGEAANFLVEGLTLTKGDYGGGLSATVGTDGAVTVNRNQIENNTGWDYGGGVSIYAYTATLTNNTITSNTGLYIGSGVGILATTATLANNNIASNMAIWCDVGGAYIGATTATLTNNSFKGNTGGYYGGGAQIRAETVTLINNSFTGNTTNSTGGGVDIGATTATLTNNSITGNTSGFIGGGVYISASTATLSNNTLAGNNADWGGGVNLRLGDDETTDAASLYNNLFWDNVAEYDADISIDNDDDYDDIPTPVTLLANNFDPSAAGFSITLPITIDPSNLNKIDPLFVNANADDFKLQPASPMIDAGYPDTPNLPATDRAGGMRVVNGIVDIGAYEYHQYESCESGPLVLTEVTFDAGGVHRESAVSIATEANVEIPAQADVLLRAPTLHFGPGLRIASGAQFMAIAGPVTCNQ